MSLTSLLSPSAAVLPGSNSPGQPKPHETVPFHHQPNYISLSRLLSRYQNIILLQPASDTLSPIQQQTQLDLRSPLPYHRSKWLHNIEYCRTLLLQLEHTAQSIRIQSQKRAAVHDLAEKRVVIRKLRRRIEDIGREVDATATNQWSGSGSLQDGEGETLEHILGRAPIGSEQQIPGSKASKVPEPDSNGNLQEGKAVRFVEAIGPDSTSRSAVTEPPPLSPASERDYLFSSGSRRRKGQHSSPSSATSATTSGFTSLPTTEESLDAANRNHDSLTSSLVTLASQLKSQSLAFQTHLASTDAGFLDRALTGLDRNITQMAGASQRLAFVRRMSEGQGWWGRLKLYAMIFGLWVAAILLVFVGPKLRF